MKCLHRSQGKSHLNHGELGRLHKVLDWPWLGRHWPQTLASVGEGKHTHTNVSAKV